MELLMTRAAEADPDPQTTETACLIRRTLAGDTAAFGQIVLKHERRVLTFSIRMLGTVEDAQDAAQEVFLRAFKYIHRLDLAKPIEPWLMQMTVNVCRDIGRKRLKRRITFPQMSDPNTAPAGESSNPYCGFAEEQQKQMLRKALCNLADKERQAVILRDVEGLTTSEVAVILGSSETTVRSQICRARLKIKEAIDQMTGGPS